MFDLVALPLLLIFFTLKGSISELNPKCPGLTGTLRYHQGCLLVIVSGPIILSQDSDPSVYAAIEGPKCG